MKSSDPQQIVRRALKAGWPLLPEPDGFSLLEGLGISVPARILFENPSQLTPEELARLPGQRAVLKAVCAGLALSDRPRYPLRDRVAGRSSVCPA